MFPEIIKTPENEHQRFTVIEMMGTFFSIFPEPVSHFGRPHKTKSDALMHTVKTYLSDMRHRQWELANKSGDCFSVCYEAFSFVEINDEDEILDDFFHFSKGDSRFDVLQWFESFFEVELSSMQ